MGSHTLHITSALTVGPDRFYLSISEYEGDIYVMDLEYLGGPSRPFAAIRRSHLNTTPPICAKVNRIPTSVSYPPTLLRVG